MSVRIVYETHSTTEDNENGIATGWLPGRLSACLRRNRRGIQLGPGQGSRDRGHRLRRHRPPGIAGLAPQGVRLRPSERVVRCRDARSSRRLHRQAVPGWRELAAGGYQSAELRRRCARALARSARPCHRAYRDQVGIRSHAARHAAGGTSTAAVRLAARLGVHGSRNGPEPRVRLRE